ncbi:hypothetical protein EJB05_47364, partial [Eragrostis curvula]
MELTTADNGVCWVVESPPLGRAICTSQYKVSCVEHAALTTLGFHTSMPVGSRSESAPLDVSWRRERDETCMGSGSSPVVLAYQATVWLLILWNQTARSVWSGRPIRLRRRQLKGACTGTPAANEP